MTQPDLFGHDDDNTAVLSDDGRYRYLLTRRWADGPRCTWIMLNPSTADATEDDPTIRRCIGFSKRERCGGLAVVNLFGYRATDPAELFQADDPTGPLNGRFLSDAITEAEGPIVCAWGANMATRVWSTTIVHDLADEAGKELLCLGTTQGGEPRHPLYIEAVRPLEPYRRPA